jgi:hypothetical protein
MHFEKELLEFQMSERLKQIGSGWFLGKFFYLFGTRVERLVPCVSAWAFLLPPEGDWTPIGYNAYGAILLLDNSGDRSADSPVGLLDPLMVTFFARPTLDLWSLLGNWMPERRLATFLDTSVYEAFLGASGRLLEDDEVLGIRRALPLGGDMALENFTPIGIVNYYRATAPTYAAAHLASERG